MPQVSLIMSTHNDGDFLRLALDSLLAQTFTDFELIVIDDASTDQTPALLATYQSDQRVHMIRNETNLGLTRSLNRGVAMAQGAYIGRMDGDDIAIPDTRLAEQIAYMTAHPEVGFLCGDMIYIDENGAFLQEGIPYYHMAGSHAYLGWRLLWLNPISHITVLMRRELLTLKAYDPDFNMAEDYELWSRLIHQTQFFRMDKPWAWRRILSTSVSHSREEDQRRLVYQIAERELTRLLGEAPPTPVLHTLLDVIHRPQNQNHAYSQAADLLQQVYQKYSRNIHLLPSDQKAILSDVVTWLFRLARRANPQERVYILWVLGKIAPRQVLSRQGLQQAFHGIIHQ